MQKEEKMSFMSKIYFGAFKRIGNLRLMFVISCLFAGISLIVVTFIASFSVKYININHITMEETLDSYRSYSQDFSYGSKLYDFVQIRLKENKEYSKSALTNKIIVKKYCMFGRLDEAFGFASKHFANVGKGKTYATPEVLCKEELAPFRIAYTFSYLWNYLWVLFWFYFPFLIVLPIKFVTDGYRKDKGENK